MPKLKKKSKLMIRKDDKFRKQVCSETSCPFGAAYPRLDSSPQQPCKPVPMDTHLVKPVIQVHSGTACPSDASNIQCHTPNLGHDEPNNSSQQGQLIPHDYIFHGLNPDSVLQGSIDITVMDYFSALLKAQFGQIHGLIPLSVIYQQELLNEQPYEQQLVPEDRDAIQIHFLNDHYVVSSKSGQTITIMDSLRNLDRIRLLTPQLFLVYRHARKMNINYVVPQSQGSSVDCGAFAAANAYFVLKGKSPCQLTLNQCSLRPHLKLCLQTQFISDFPLTTRTFGSTFLDKYWEDQAYRQKKRHINSISTSLKHERENEEIKTKKCVPNYNNEEIPIGKNEKDNFTTKMKSVNPEERLRRNERKALAKKIKREDIGERKKRNEREALAQRKKRSDPEVRRKRNEREVLMKRKRREDPEVQKKTNERETLARKQKREDPEIRRRQNEQETPVKRKKREDSEVRKQRNERETPAQRKKRENSEIRKERNERETLAQRKNREHSKVRKQRNERETPAQRKKREDSEVRKQRNERETPAQRKKREDSEVRKHRNEKETPAQRKKREDSEVRKQRNVKEALAKREKRQPSGNLDKALDNFKTDIQNGPTFVCTVCNRMLYRTSLRRYNCDNYDRDMLNCNTNKKSYDGVEYICTLCHNALKHDRLPAIAIKNNMELSEVPYEIEQLNSLETVFISRRIPFMKLLALPRGKQKAVHGCVVNVPIEPDQIVSVLPRVPSADSFIKVKLKRKLKYRGHSYNSTIRPSKIIDALVLLKNQLQNPLYEDVLLNENWIEDSSNEDSVLWDSLVPANQSVNSHDNNEQLTESEEETDKEDEHEDNRSKLSGIPFDTCIQPKDIVNESVLSIAPGEGKRPVSFAQDKYAEELSFPQLFPTGKFGFSHERPTKLSLKKYFQARLLNCDGRFAKNIDYIFYAQYRVEAKEVYDSISLSLRKGKQQHITAGELSTKVQELVRTDLGIHFMQKIRGSPAFFNKMFYDLLGMIRQLGPCTLFLTLSAADLKWIDTISVIAKRQGKQLRNEDIQNLSWEEKCQYLRSDPVTAARHFNNRVSMFFKHILLNKRINPLGEVTDYKYRIEFQQRGSPHLHMLLWIKDAPVIGTSTESDVIQYIDRTISCELPENDPDLRDLIGLVQKHTHSVACRKHGKTCRFCFPRPPLDETLIFMPLENPPSNAMQEVYSTALTSVFEQLKVVEEFNTLQEILDKAKVTKQLYLNALHWIKTRGGQPAVLLKRKPVTCFCQYQ